MYRYASTYIYTYIYVHICILPKHGEIALLWATCVTREFTKRTRDQRFSQR